jgi:hypothetical protein
VALVKKSSGFPLNYEGSGAPLRTAGGLKTTQRILRPRKMRPDSLSSTNFRGSFQHVGPLKSKPLTATVAGTTRSRLNECVQMMRGEPCGRPQVGSVSGTE